MDQHEQQGQQPIPRRRPTRPRPRRNILLPILLILFFGGVFVLLMGLTFLVFLFRGPTPVKVTHHSVLRINLEGSISEYEPPNPFDRFLDRKVLHLQDYVGMIEKAKNDPKIEGILLWIGTTNLGWAQREDLREALSYFRASGKWIITTGEVWEERDYFLACAGDEIYLSPESMLLLDGFMSKTNFYGDLLDKYGIGVHVEAFGEFKSMADGYRYNSMRDPVREATKTLLTSIEQTFLAAVEASGKLDAERFKRELDRAIYEVPVAKELGLLDDVLYLDQIEDLIAKKLGSDAEVHFISDHQYWTSRRDTFSGQNAVAVIYASGGIQSGSGRKGVFGDPVIGSAGFIEDLKAARNNDKVKAIVIRIDSPGGSMLASDLIWREIRLTVEKGIPVIASMGNVAASGGYYMAMACDEIVAQPTTITGSIGIVAMRLDFDKLLEKLMVNTEVVKTSPSADFFDFSRTLTPEEKHSLHQRTKVGYETFLTKAARARGLENEEMDHLARGRVWSGDHARDLNLVDHLGSLLSAIEIAAKKADLERYQVISYPLEDRWNFFGSDLPSLSETATPSSLGNLLPYELRLLRDVSNRKNGFHLFTMAPYHLQID